MSINSKPVITDFWPLGSKNKTETEIITFKVDMVILLAKTCLFTHQANGVKRHD